MHHTLLPSPWTNRVIGFCFFDRLIMTTPSVSVNGALWYENTGVMPSGNISRPIVGLISIQIGRCIGNVKLTSNLSPTRWYFVI